MKWIYRFFTALLLAGAIAAPFFMKNKGGEPMLSFPSAGEIVPSVDDIKGLKDNPERLIGQRTVYKWQDEKGIWHYGDAPPTQSAQVSMLQVDSQTNIIQSLKVETEDPQKEDDAKPSNITDLPKSTSDVLTVENAMNIIEDAQSARAMMEQRGEQLRQIIGEE